MTKEMRDVWLAGMAEEHRLSKAAFIRWIVEEMHEGRMLHLTRAVREFATMLMEGFGGGVALLAAEAERTVLESDRWRGTNHE